MFANMHLTNRLVWGSAGSILDVAGRKPRVGKAGAEEESVRGQREGVLGVSLPVVVVENAVPRECVHR